MPGKYRKLKDYAKPNKNLPTGSKENVSPSNNDDTTVHMEDTISEEKEIPFSVNELSTNSLNNNDTGVHMEDTISEEDEFIPESINEGN